jgi:outer membrane protein
MRRRPIAPCCLALAFATAGLVAQEPVLTIGDAVRATLAKNPDLLNSADTLAVTRFSESSIKSAYLPQVNPFLSTSRDPVTGDRIDSYGFNASQQFAFGPLLSASGNVTHDPTLSPTTPYASTYSISLTQPLLRGLDPAVTGEPLREARRATQGQERAFDITRRRAVLAVYAAYLGFARELRALAIARERAERARSLTEFSRARFTAGNISRLDVLRAEQQQASADVAENDAVNAVDDARDILRRTAGLPRDYVFDIRPPVDIPVGEPSASEAAAGVMDRRPEALEARDQVVDAEFAVRIAKSQQLPSLSAVLGYSFANLGSNFGETARPRSPIFTFNLRSDYNLNASSLYAARRSAEVQLETRRRNLAVLEDDLVREVQRAYRRLGALSKNMAIAAENLRVAELQLEVARLRFEKGLSDNFNVIDAENLLNAARLLELDSRFAILLARLDCLFASGAFSPDAYKSQP